MFGVGPTELLVILVVALLVLGPKRLPEIARALGKGLAEFRRATADVTSELDNARIMLEQEAREASRRTAAKAEPKPEQKTYSRTAAAPEPEKPEKKDGQAADEPGAPNPQADRTPES
jgi:sec-independent protein translocase protein TatB